MTTKALASVLALALTAGCSPTRPGEECCVDRAEGDVRVTVEAVERGGDTLSVAGVATSGVTGRPLPYASAYLETPRGVAGAALADTAGRFEVRAAVDDLDGTRFVVVFAGLHSFRAPVDSLRIDSLRDGRAP